MTQYLRPKRAAEFHIALFDGCEIPTFVLPPLALEMTPFVQSLQEMETAQALEVSAGKVQKWRVAALQLEAVVEQVLGGVFLFLWGLLVVAVAL
jgi:hypothetical protein